MLSPAWLTAQPIAHRGLHNSSAGIIENTRTAGEAAAQAGFAIECDVQISADGEAVVFHDFTLERLTNEKGRVDALTYSELTSLSYKQSTDRIMSLAEYIDLIGGRVPLIIEIKSRFDNNLRLAHRTAEIVRDRSEPVALMSFDPNIVECLRDLSPGLPRGIVAEAHYQQEEWQNLTDDQRNELIHFTHVTRSQPDFIAWHIKDFPHAIPTLMRHFERPILTWTVRTADDRAQARQFSDQIIFEGFHP